MRLIILSLLIMFSFNVAAKTVGKLSYQVTESGSESYISQIWVSNDWVRLDQKDDNSGYILYDRNKKIIYNIFHDDARLLTINPVIVQHSVPDSIALTTSIEKEEKAPKVSGQTPMSYNVVVDKKPCMQLIVIPEVMTNELAGWKEFLARLSDQQSANIPATPEELRDNCNFVEHVYSPTIALDKGLPVVWNTDFRKMRLIDFKPSIEVEDKFFTMPTDYSQGSMPLGSAQ